MALRQVFNPRLALAVGFPAKRVPAAALNAKARHLIPVAVSQQRSRGIGTVAIDNYDEGVAFGELLACLDTHYGLASRFVHGTLSELAQILGYASVEDDTLLTYGDAQILMEEIGAPPLTPEEFRDMKDPVLDSSADELHVQDSWLRFLEANAEFASQLRQAGFQDEYKERWNADLSLFIEDMERAGWNVCMPEPQDLPENSTLDLHEQDNNQANHADDADFLVSSSKTSESTQQRVTTRPKQKLFRRVM